MPSAVRTTRLEFSGVSGLSASFKTVGVLGGMGPDATIDFLSEVVSLTKAGCDQDHIPMLVDNNTKVPNRQAAILGDGDDPGPIIGQMGRRLEAAGADFLVMPCNSAHAFLEPLAELTTIPLISIIEVTADACNDCSSVGVLATDGCLEFGGFQQALLDRGVTPVVPDAPDVAELMRLITCIKAGDKGPEVHQSMGVLAETLVERGAEAIIAGCTEIPLVLSDGELPVPVISSTRALAEATIAAAVA